MAHATVGVAMGTAGSNVALETADVALVADSLSNLPFAIGLSRATNRIIRQNLWISLRMVALLVPATLVGLAVYSVDAFNTQGFFLLATKAPKFKCNGSMA